MEADICQAYHGEKLRQQSVGPFSDTEASKTPQSTGQLQGEATTPFSTSSGFTAVNTTQPSQGSNPFATMQNPHNPTIANIAETFDFYTKNPPVVISPGFSITTTQVILYAQQVQAQKLSLLPQPTPHSRHRGQTPSLPCKIPTILHPVLPTAPRPSIATPISLQL